MQKINQTPSAVGQSATLQTHRFDPRNRLVSQGVSLKMPLSMQKRLWSLVDKRMESGAKMSYMQAFSLFWRNGKQYIAHQQEGYQKTHAAPACKHGMRGKIYIVDFQNHCTMMFFDEF
jgi:hypothetical protein